MGRKQIKSRNIVSWFIVACSLALFALIFGRYHVRYGGEVAALAILPITAGYWYFGFRGGIFTTGLCILVYVLILIGSDQRPWGILTRSETIIGSFALLFSGLAFGRVATFARERRDALIRLAHSNDLVHSLLHVITQIETAFNPDEFAKSLSLELGEIGIHHVVALFNKKEGVFTFDYTSIKPDLLDIIENNTRHPLRDHIFTLQQLGVTTDETSRLPSLVIEDPQAELQALFNNHDPQHLQEFLRKCLKT